MDLAWGEGGAGPLGRMQGPPQGFILMGQALALCQTPGLAPGEQDCGDDTGLGGGSLSWAHFTDMESEASGILPEAALLVRQRQDPEPVPLL